MRLAPDTTRGATVLASCFVLIGLTASVGHADEPQSSGRLARLFRFGGASSPSAPPAGHVHTNDAPTTSAAGLPVAATPPSTPTVAADGPAPRIAPQPRVSRPPTEADPIVSRVAIGRSDGGGQFAMFLEVFADGTVIDSEGVHRVGNDVMKPLMEALRLGELYRLKGHCGAPSTDFIEHAHVVIYERSLGKLRATSFSYSGNPQGCDPSVKKLHAALDAVQNKLSTTTSTSTSTSTTKTTTASPVPAAGRPALPAPSLPAGGPPVLELSPNP
jgi:hypothetical protein